MEDLAPIILFVYNRPIHTRRTVESLLKNSLAEFSDLFIFSDGNKSENDKKQVEEVREYIRDIKGFRNIKIVENKLNLGLANSVINGVSEVLKSFKKIIVIEDDIITSKHFLKFINDALNFYENNELIFSVTGYSFPFKVPDIYKHNVYLSPRPSSWAWATWRNRWIKVDWEIRDYELFINDKDLIRLFNKGGEDLAVMLKRFKQGKIDSWAIRWCYAHFKHKAYCLYPVFSYADNIGTDNSGTNFKNSTKFKTKISESEIHIYLPPDIEPNEELLKEFHHFFTPSIYRKISNYLYLRN